MLTFLRKVPIKRKLAFITMITSTFALLLACVAFVTYEQLTFRGTMARDFAILADMFGYNIASSLALKDANSMEETLKTLGANPHIMAAAAYDIDGRVVARYLRAKLPATFVFPHIQPTGSQFLPKRLDTFQKVTLKGKDIGTVYIASDLEKLNSRLKKYAAILCLVFAASSIAAFILSAKLRTIISEPILELAAVTHSVAVDKNYSVRASKRHEDEIGALIDSFNEMLTQIQARDSALEAARNDLETKISERTRELADSVSLLNATLESTADGIVAVQFSGKMVCFNSQYAAMWGIPAALLEEGNAEKLITFAGSQVHDPEAYVKRVQDLRNTPEADAFDVFEMKDGRTFERYVKLQRINGRPIGNVINFRDITERKRGEQELESAHKQLLEISRQAGMAEVATSVLHNVGNVLNSVNVSCSLIAEKIRKSRVPSVAKTAQLLRDHETDLASFFADDPVGAKLPAFLEKLAERLSSEQFAMGEELQLLGQNIQHIRDIIAVQQSYANIGGLRDTLPIADVVEDAIRMNAQGLKRHHVEVVREFDEVPLASIEKHKVLQVLVNLVRNAKHALTDSGRLDKRMVVRIARGEEDSIRVSVIDNGVGILTENLTRIFSHGFTTKKNGHGFGLHCGVLAAQEMGGSLTAESAGPGEGATFTLELPILSNSNN